MKDKRLWWIIVAAAVLGIIVAWVVADYRNSSYSATPKPYKGGRVGDPCQNQPYRNTHPDVCK